jgi:hypothetical protein
MVHLHRLRSNWQGLRALKIIATTLLDLHPENFPGTIVSVFTIRYFTQKFIEAYRFIPGDNTVYCRFCSPKNDSQRQ